jgi:uncharacterized protein DUF6677
LVKSERMHVEVEPTPGSAWLMGLAAWFVPGLGHALLGKWQRALLMGGVVWLCLVIGLVMGGHMFDLNVPENSSLPLQALPMVADVGSGAPYIIAGLLGYGFADDPQQAARTTYEYGTTFLLIGGLLNYLVILDAFDIAAGRKS